MTCHNWSDILSGQKIEINLLERLGYPYKLPAIIPQRTLDLKD
jgi:hypothetical protein